MHRLNIYANTCRYYGPFPYGNGDRDLSGAFFTNDEKCLQNGENKFSPNKIEIHEQNIV